MASKFRVFTAFAYEDKWARDYMVGQAKNEKTPFEFIDMSLNEPFDEKWKTQCRSRIKGCDGMIALVSKNTANGTGALWEIRTAKEEKVPVRGIYTTSDNRPASLPNEFSGISVVYWSWANLKEFLDSL